ncbi:DUF6197 family protein [Mycobacterium sp. TJFP1]
MTARDIWVTPSHHLVIEKLSEARQLVRFGWCQGQAHVVIEGADCYCIVGAVSEVCGTVRLSDPVTVAGEHIAGRVIPGAWIRDAVTAALVDALPRTAGSPASWNDVRGRTQDDVVQLFTSAIGIVSRRAAA